MVKRFISGILGKKEEETKKGTSEEIPDELPSLAEDIVAKASEAKEAKAEPISKEKEEVPEELPPLDENPMQDKSEESAEIGTLDELEKESIPQEIKRAKLAKTRLPEAKAEAEGYTAKERIKVGTEDEGTKSEQWHASEQFTRSQVSRTQLVGFFSNILEHIKKHGGAKEKLLAGDLFSRMGNYWEIRKHEIKTGIQLPAEKKLEEDLLSKLEELKNLEQKWQVQKLALEEDMKFIHERERDIQTKIKELKMVSNELSLFRNVKPEEYFYVHNGIVLKSLHDLIDILEVIDEETFNFHVGNNKNDFSDWISHVFKDNNLADKIKNAKIKMEMIEILETIPIISKEVEKDYPLISPKRYFWLANGSVIRSLYELSDALKVMDDELFKKHADETKNDFAKWVKDALKNEHLAEKLNKAKTKKEMIEILEIFL